LWYVRDADADGSTWGSGNIVRVDGDDTLPNDTGQYTSLAVVNGNPAII
jgi:hypothetical protein